MEFDPVVLQDLDKWVQSRGGRVSSKLLHELYKISPNHKLQLQGRLSLLADCAASTVHLATNAENLGESLELKSLGNKPYRPYGHAKRVPAAAAVAAPVAVAPVVAVPAAAEGVFTQQSNYRYAVARSAPAVRAVMSRWQDEFHCLGFAFKGDVREGGQISLMQIATPDRQVLIMDLAKNHKLMLDSGMKAYFEDHTKTKVLADSPRVVEALRTLWNIAVVNVFDLGRASLVIKQGGTGGKLDADVKSTSLRQLLLEFHLDTRVVPQPVGWFNRPLTKTQIEYAVRGVMQNCQVYDLLLARAKASPGLEQACLEESAAYMHSMHGKTGENLSKWTCAKCNYSNFDQRSTCKTCGAAASTSSKPTATTPKAVEGMLSALSLADSSAAAAAKPRTTLTTTTAAAAAPAKVKQPIVVVLEQKPVAKTTTATAASPPPPAPLSAPPNDNAAAAAAAVDGTADQIKQLAAQVQQLQLQCHQQQQILQQFQVHVQQQFQQQQLHLLQQSQQYHAQLQQYALVAASAARPAAAAAASGSSSSTDNDKPEKTAAMTASEGQVVLAMEVEAILEEAGISPEWAAALIQCAQAAGGAYEMRQVDLVLFQKLLNQHHGNMPIELKFKFVKAVFKRRNVT